MALSCDRQVQAHNKEAWPTQSGSEAQGEEQAGCVCVTLDQRFKKSPEKQKSQISSGQIPGQESKASQSV